MLASWSRYDMGMGLEGWRDEPNASMASGMVLKAGLVVPFGCCWGAIVGGRLVVFFLAVLGLRSSGLFRRGID